MLNYLIDTPLSERLKAKQAKPQPQTHSRGNQTDVTAVNDKHLPDDNLPFAQRKAALNLTQLANNDAALDSDSVQNLISTLIVSDLPLLNDYISSPPIRKLTSHSRPKHPKM